MEVYPAKGGRNDITCKTMDASADSNNKQDKPEERKGQEAKSVGKRGDSTRTCEVWERLWKAGGV